MADSTQALLSAIEGWRNENGAKKGHENTVDLLSRLHGELTGNNGNNISPGARATQELVAEIGKKANAPADRSNEEGAAPVPPSDPTPEPFNDHDADDKGRRSTEQSAPEARTPAKPAPTSNAEARRFAAEKIAHDMSNDRSQAKAPEPGPSKPTSTAVASNKPSQSANASPSGREKPDNYPDHTERVDVQDLFRNAKKKALAKLAR